MTSVFSQHDYQVRLEWGPPGVATLAADCRVIVIVDVLSFCTAVDIAVARGAAVLPLPWPEPAAAPPGAVLAGRRGSASWSLSPSSLLDLPAGTRLALPSPNGATLSATAATHCATVLAACLRNAAAVASAALACLQVPPLRPKWAFNDSHCGGPDGAVAGGGSADADGAVAGGGSADADGAVAGGSADADGMVAAGGCDAGRGGAGATGGTCAGGTCAGGTCAGGTGAGGTGAGGTGAGGGGAGGSGAIGVVPAGERWPDGGLRPAVEDLLGAGAVVAAVLAAVGRYGVGACSPEALATADAFEAASSRGLAEALATCSSGRELAAGGFGADVALAAEYDVSSAAPVLRDGEYRPFEPGPR